MAIKYIHKNTNFFEFFIFKTNFFWSIYLFNFYNFTICWTYKIKDKHGNDIIVVQIAGLVARRIVCETDKNQELNQGDRIGMIRFGSRADVYYENYEPLVKVGQTAISGETLLAKK